MGALWRGHVCLLDLSLHTTEMSLHKVRYGFSSYFFKYSLHQISEHFSLLCTSTSYLQDSLPYIKRFASNETEVTRYCKNLELQR